MHHHMDRSEHGVTNYVTALDQIDDWARRSGDAAYLITFNYDLMLDDALRSVGIRINSMDDYVANKTYKLIKIHGSVGWGREIETEIKNVDSRNHWELVNEYIERAEELQLSNRFRRLDGSWPIAR